MLPQQVIAPSLLTAQACVSPALIAVNVPDEGALLTWLLLLRPQHEIAPALVNAQAKLEPALIAVNVPDAGASARWR